MPTAPAPASTPTPTLGAFLPPTATLTGTPPPSPTAPPPAETITLPTGVVRTLPSGTFALQASRAFTLVGTVARYPTFTIRMVNVTTGTSTRVASLPPGHQPTSLTVVGDRVVWVESWYAHPQTGTGTGGNPNLGQPLLWQINSVSVTTGTRSVIASGSNTRIPVGGEAAGPLPPVLAADGDRVAYTLDRAGRQDTDASAIIVRSLSSGAVLRRVDADGYVAQVGLIGQRLFFRQAFGIAGTSASVFPFDASLMLARSDGEAPRLIDTHVSHAAMDAQTLVWSHEDATDASIWATPLSTEVPFRVEGPPLIVAPGQPGPTSDLAVGSGAVGWIVWYPGADGSWTSALVVWRAGDTEGRMIGGQGQPDWVVIEDGSLIWHEYLSLPGHDTHAVPISALP
ncbi:MAG TPA: hypothetical protein VIK13_15095 [Candidatus Limnocylindrales bacterium]